MTKRQHKKLIQLKKVTVIIEKGGYLPSFLCTEIYKLSNDVTVSDIKFLEKLSKKYLRCKGYYKQNSVEVKKLYDQCVCDLKNFRKGG